MNNSTINDRVLLDYMNSFFGYGNLNSNYWFIGMEEGSNGTIEEIVARLKYWEEGGKLPLEDLVLYHRKFGVDRFFSVNAKLQPTWNKLIRIQLSAEGQEPHREMVRQFQVDRLGRHSSNNCLIEFLPLPSKSTANWIYSKHSNIPELSSREAYRRVWMPKRAQAIRDLVIKHKPKSVVFYSVHPEYQYWWKSIANSQNWSTYQNVQVTRNEHTVFAITRHPVTKGISTTYFHYAGKLITQISNIG